MSGKFLTLCVVGLLGSLFIGYCVYFDKKRRSDPDYKKKVVASKLVNFGSSYHVHLYPCLWEGNTMCFNSSETVL